MQYIILDMEWNQPWPGSPTSKKVLPAPIHGEIIQIGAVRVLEDQTVADEFQILVRPKFYRRLNKRISSLTGIKEYRLKADGVPFPEAVAQFKAWCGEEPIFLTWGFDDINILRENLCLYALPTQWVENWYNAQMFFNAQTDGSSQQKALKTAMELFGIEPSRPAHDALGDAYHTALICSRLDLHRGIQEYRSALESHEQGFHGQELPGCIDRQVFHGYADKNAVFHAMEEEENKCPVCGEAMKLGKWISQPGKRYMVMASCPKHGKFLVRIRLCAEADGSFRVSRLLYEGDSAAAKTYEKVRKDSLRRHRRRRKRSADSGRSTGGETAPVTGQ